MIFILKTTLNTIQNTQRVILCYVIKLITINSEPATFQEASQAPPPQLGKVCKCNGKCDESTLEKWNLGSH